MMLMSFSLHNAPNIAAHQAGC